jgi:hypothetical protein
MVRLGDNCARRSAAVIGTRFGGAMESRNMIGELGH